MQSQLLTMKTPFSPAMCITIMAFRNTQLRVMIHMISHLSLLNPHHNAANRLKNGYINK